MPPQNFKLKSLEIIAQENRQLELPELIFDTSYWMELQRT